MTATTTEPRIGLGELQLALAFFATHPLLPTPTRLEVHRFGHDYHPDVAVGLDAKLANREELDAWAAELDAAVTTYPGSHAAIGELGRLEQDVFGTTISVEFSCSLRGAR